MEYWPRVWQRLSRKWVQESGPINRRPQHVLDAERPDAPLPAALLCRLGRDVGDAVDKMQRQAEAISRQAQRSK